MTQLDMFFRINIIFLIFTVFFSCTNVIDEGRKHADDLIKQIANENAEELFTPIFFNKDETKAILNSLIQDCQFENRKGGFYTQKSYRDSELDYLIGEYTYMFDTECGSIYVIASYNLVEMNLFRFGLKPFAPGVR